MTKKICTAVLFCMAVFAGARSGHADTIYASSQLGTQTTFDVLLSGAPVTFNAGSTISITGLSGVTAASLLSSAGYYGTLTQTDTSVSYQLAYAMQFSGGAPYDLALFSVMTSRPYAGGAVFSLGESTGNVTGSIAAPTPEPAGIVLFGTGLTGVVWLARRRLLAGPSGAEAFA